MLFCLFLLITQIVSIQKLDFIGFVELRKVFMKKDNKIEWKNFFSEIKKSKSDLEKVSNVMIKINDTVTTAKSAYQDEINQIKTTMQNVQGLTNATNKLAEVNSQQAAIAQSLVDTYQEASLCANTLSDESDELVGIFNSAIGDMIDGTKDFGDIMKSVLNDLKKYFIKLAQDAITNSVISQTTGNALTSAINGANFFSGGFFSGLFGSVLSSHHSGGVIPSGTGYSLPGTSEYLSVLKGGERVLSPAENVAYNNSQTDRKNIVVNNFNVKAWDSKDVQKYLLENKSLLASITAENIKYNNANLKYAVNGI